MLFRSKISKNALDKYFTSNSVTKTVNGQSVPSTTTAAKPSAPAVYDAVGNKVSVTKMADRVVANQQQMPLACVL